MLAKTLFSHLVYCLNGSLAGLVEITAPCASVCPDVSAIEEKEINRTKTPEVPAFDSE